MLFQSDGGTGAAQELDLTNVGGVFFVLVVGSALGLAVGMCELLCGTLRRSAKDRRPLSQQLSEEVNFLLTRNKVKPIRRSTSVVRDQPSSAYRADLYGFVVDNKH